jgi:hypothetical protein
MTMIRIVQTLARIEFTPGGHGSVIPSTFTSEHLNNQPSAAHAFAAASASNAMRAAFCACASNI